jgi:hypothetical protein
MTKQRAIIVGTANIELGTAHRQVGMEELNKLLEEGWMIKDVHMMTPLAGGQSNSLAMACLIVVQKPAV